jgi:hypothetical protein
LPTVWRLYTIRVPPGIDLEKLNERLREAIRVPYAEIHLDKDGRLRIVLVGPWLLPGGFGVEEVSL